MAEDVKTAETTEDVTTVVADEESTEKAAEGTTAPESESQTAPEATEQTAQKAAQTEEQNAVYARARREREQAAAIEKAKAEAAQAERVKNIVDFVKTNPFTNKPIKTAEDVDQYLLMKRISDDGGEPLQDYATYVDRKAKEAEQEKQQVEENEAQMRSDISDFRKAHPEVKLEELLKDEAFVGMYGEKVGKTPLNTLYGQYQTILNKVREQERKRLVAEAAKSNSGVGSVATPKAVPEITAGQFKRMGLSAKEKLFEENPELYRELAGK